MIVAKINVEERVASLDDAGVWHSDDESVTKLLNARFPAEMFDPSPRDGITRYSQVKAAAEYYRSAIRFTRPQPGVQNRVY